MPFCRAEQVLLVGTKVCVGNKVGTVLKAEMVPAHPCGQVALHTIRFTHKRIKLWASNFKEVPMKKELVTTVGYGSIWFKE